MCYFCVRVSFPNERASARAEGGGGGLKPSLISSALFWFFSRAGSPCWNQTERFLFSLLYFYGSRKVPLNISALTVGGFARAGSLSQGGGGKARAHMCECMFMYVCVCGCSVFNALILSVCECVWGREWCVFNDSEKLDFIRWKVLSSLRCREKIFNCLPNQVRSWKHQSARASSS